MLILIKS